jgi:hypothetical protein
MVSKFCAYCRVHVHSGNDASGVSISGPGTSVVSDGNAVTSVTSGKCGLFSNNYSVKCDEFQVDFGSKAFVS